MVFESRVRAKNILNQQNVEICKIKNTSLDKYVYIGNSCIPYIKALDSKTLNKVMANIFSFHLKILYFKKLIFRQKNPYKRILNIFTSLLLIIINGPCIKNIPWSMPPPPKKTLLVSAISLKVGFSVAYRTMYTVIYGVHNGIPFKPYYP